MTFMDVFDGPAPKRGDLVQSNLGNRRERTWFVLRSRQVRQSPKGVPRFKLWMVRWWELEPDMRMRLFRSAVRNGGQNLFRMRRYPAKRKPHFEQQMKRLTRAHLR